MLRTVSRGDASQRVVLWNVATTSNAATVVGLLLALGGEGLGSAFTRTGKVEAWPDGLVITGATDGDDWVPWQDVVEIGPPAVPIVKGVPAWVEFTMKDGSSVRLGRRHLVGDGDDALAEAADKIELLRRARTAWWTGAWPPTGP